MKVINVKGFFYEIGVFRKEVYDYMKGMFYYYGKLFWERKRGSYIFLFIFKELFIFFCNFK